MAKSEDRFGDEIEVVRIDPASSAVGEPATVHAGVPVRIAAGEGGVWTTLIGGVGIQQREQEATVALIDPGAGAVWVANSGDGTVTRINPGTE